MKLNYEEIDYIIETLVNKSNVIDFVSNNELFKKENLTKLDKELELINSIIEKLEKEKERLLNEED